MQCREINAVTEEVYKGVSNPQRVVSEGFSKAVTSDFRLKVRRGPGAEGQTSSQREEHVHKSKNDPFG